LIVAESSAPIVGASEAGSRRAVAAMLFALVPLAALIHYGPDVGYWFPALVIALAIVGLLLFRRPFVAGPARPGLTIAALPAGIVALAAAIGLAAAAGAVEQRSRPDVSWGLFLGGTLLIVAKAFGEELLFRGLLQPILCRAWGAFAGIVMAALAFMAIHVIGGWRDPVSLANIALGGGWFGLLAWRTGGILAPTLAHAAYNWAEEMLFGATPNPGLGGFGALYDFDLVGSARLGGSADGLNASLLLTLVLVAIILPLVFGRPGMGKAKSNMGQS